MGRYVDDEIVKSRLKGKVKFDEPDGEDPNKMSVDLFESCVNEAETQLEIDMMSRYEIPFKSSTGDFATLPDSTQTIIKTLGELLSVVRILETDFGRGTSVNAEKYTEQLQKRYDGLLTKIMEVKSGTYSTWLRPPLQGLVCSYQNQGDSGFRGKVMNTSTIKHQADYAYKQINSPGETIFNGSLDPLDDSDTN